MSRNSKMYNKHQIAKQYSQMHKLGQRGPGKTTSSHGKKKRLPFKNAKNIADKQATEQKKQHDLEAIESIVDIDV